MRVEKDGFVLHLESTWMEISNKYGVQGVYRDSKLGDCINNGISAHASDFHS